MSKSCDVGSRAVLWPASITVGVQADPSCLCCCCYLKYRSSLGISVSAVLAKKLGSIPLLRTNFSRNRSFVA